MVPGLRSLPQAREPTCAGEDSIHALPMALEKGAMSRSNASDRNGQVVLFLVFLSLLAGRFTLRRLAPGLPDIDLRWITLATCLLAFLGWVAVEREMAVPLV